MADSFSPASKPAHPSRPPPQPVASTSTLPPRPKPRTPFFPSAAQPEIIRANQKDLYYLGELTEQVEEAARGLLGTRWLQTWSQELSVLSKLAYFSLTTVLGTQTLGEEYCDILQYTAKDRSMPSRVRRAALVSLHIVAPYTCVRIYGALRKRLADNRRARQAAESSERGMRFASAADEKAMPTDQPASRRFHHWLSTLELPAFERVFDEHFTAIHLCIFYLTGRYYHASKRATGIRYLATQSSSTLGNTRPPSYEILGLLMAIQLLVRGILAFRSALPQPEPEPQTSEKEAQRMRKKVLIDGRQLDTLVFDPDDPTPPAEEEEDVDAPYDEESQSRRCTLCLGPRRDPTSTECGHVFCWECIVGWSREKQECPLCRQAVQLQGLLPVYNL